MHQIKVSLNNRSYPIIIADDNFEALAKKLVQLRLGTDAVIITNTRVRRLYARELQNALNTLNISAHIFNVPDSEKSKSISEYVKIISKISAMDTKKRLFLIALGGGVVGDLTGFIAATYKRGIPYIQIPTTLLAQVDSAIGGKTALDLPSGKNLIGAFYQPKLVYSNINLIKSLPSRQIRCGLAEVVKYGIIVDTKLFGYIEKNYKKILDLDNSSLGYIINASSLIKAKIVENDERETTGLRTILNFGHTIGHSLETAAGYSNLDHGEAISIGMVCSAEIAHAMGILPADELKRIIKIMKILNLPQEAKKVDIKAVLGAFLRDKKFINGHIRMVLPSRIGHVFVTENIPYNLIKKVIKKRMAPA
ncbi:MAG: 3-dehydroquinate synthase [Candidatus Omnitrophica bacterium]|nr:3-dehydroquinate synthase [Candidatus Omnitrophota bacterium]